MLHTLKYLLHVSISSCFLFNSTRPSSTLLTIPFINASTSRHPFSFSSLLVVPLYNSHHAILLPVSSYFAPFCPFTCFPFLACSPSPSPPPVLVWLVSRHRGLGALFRLFVPHFSFSSHGVLVSLVCGSIVLLCWCLFARVFLLRLSVLVSRTPGFFVLFVSLLAVASAAWSLFLVLRKRSPADGRTFGICAW